MGESGIGGATANVRLEGALFVLVCSADFAISSTICSDFVYS
jgi:hypothetical protein